MISGLSVVGANAVGLAILIFVNIFVIIVGSFLLAGQNWARIAAMVLSAITILNGILYMVAGYFLSIINTVLNIVILFYLGTNREVREAFSEKREYYDDDYPDDTDYYAEAYEAELYDEEEGMDAEYAEVEEVEDEKTEFQEALPVDPSEKRITFRVKTKESE